MKPIDFFYKPIAPIARVILSLLQPIDNLLHGVVRNRFKSQIVEYIYIYINYYYLLTYFYIYPLISNFLGFFHVCVRVCVREAIGLKKRLSPGSNDRLTFYAHYCLDCQMMYFGKELNVVKPCVRCSSKNVLNGPLMNSKEKSANVAENNNQLFLGVRKMKNVKTITKYDVAIVLILIATTLALWLGGCQSVNIGPDDLQALADQTQQLSSQVDQFQQQTTATLETLKQNGSIDSNSLAKVEKLQSGIDAVQNKTAVIADALKNAQYSGSDGLTTVLEGARAANAASAPFNPYAPLIEIGLGLAAAFAAVMAKKNAQKAAEAQAKYDAHKQGVELTMKQVSQSTVPEVKAVETQLYQNIGDARKTNIGS